MKSWSRLALGLCAAAALVFLSAPLRAEEPKPLTFCAEPAALPRTGKTADGKAEGLDVAVAQLIGKTLGRKVEFHWCASASCSWRCLAENRCDVILGQPQGSGPPRDLAWSVPYAGSQFGLVVPADARDIKGLADLLGKRIGLVAGSVPLSEKDHAVAAFKTREEILTGFGSAKLDAAFVDADFAAWHLHEHPKLKLRLVEKFTPRERWNMAVAVRPGDAGLLVDINRALAQLLESGDLKKAYEGYGVPYRPPFTDSAGRPALVQAWTRIRERGELCVSMDPDNLPYSSAKELPGFDVELARALAKELGLKLKLDWFDVKRETAIGELLEGDCDLAMGAAVDANAVEDDAELADKVIYSRPYYGTGYVLVQRKKGPHVKSLADLKGEKSRRLGAEAGSWADYQLRQRGYLRRLYRNQSAVLKAITEGDIDFGYLWANVGWTLHSSSDTAVQVVADAVPVDHWNIAVAMRKGDDELKRHVDAAIDKLVQDGTVATALTRYRVPYFATFKEDKEKKGAADEIFRHPVANRGPEPRLQTVQTSKTPYSGLARVRSAGVLVVGLDQNNLPFSTAHPKPAGLDYDIAKLLADKLGLTLQVYWGYSSHDSYPSKLATKNLCDVMLGVMPDDRFGKRVLYSKPYYVGAYRLVVRAGDNSPKELKDLGDEPLAVEDGLAVRGLEKRNLKKFSKLNEVLEAVVRGQVKAGYAISTRGPWLAQQHWPEKLKFVALGEDADRFPLCAAVRKSDGDLKDAIDNSFAELDQSGRLAEVFARWHIPYKKQ